MAGSSATGPVSADVDWLDTNPRSRVSSADETPGGTKLALAACIVWAGLMPAGASAGGFTLGPPVPTTPQTEGITCSGPLACKEEVSSITLVQRTVPDAGVTLVAPADGVVTSWRVSGKGTVKLRVLHTVSGALTGGGTSARG